MPVRQEGNEQSENRLFVTDDDAFETVP
jgi:hypothetical protein